MQKTLCHLFKTRGNTIGMSNYATIIPPSWDCLGHGEVLMVILPMFDYVADMRFDCAVEQYR